MSDGFYYRFIGIKLGDPKQMDEDGSLIGNTIWAGQGDEDLNDKDIKEEDIKAFFKSQFKLNIRVNFVNEGNIVNDGIIIEDKRDKN